MFYSKPSGGAASYADASLSLPAPAAPYQGGSATNPSPTLGWRNDATLAGVALATVALEATWPLNDPADDIQQIEAEQADSEQKADEWSIETPTTAPARNWVRSLAVWAPGASRSTLRQRNAKSALAAEAGAAGIALMRPDEPPGKRGGVWVTAGLMGDPKPDYVRAELREDEGHSVPLGQDD
jgi:hypothetical protein